MVSIARDARIFEKILRCFRIRSRCRCSGRKPGGAPGVLRRTPLHQDVSPPVSRVLYGPHRKRCGRDGHSSATPVARRLKQPTRTAGPDRPALARHAAPIRFCSRWGLPCRLRCRKRGALLPHRFTLAPANTQRGRGGLLLCGTVPEVRTPLARRRPSPDVIRHRLSMEPGLSSPATFR